MDVGIEVAGTIFSLNSFLKQYPDETGVHYRLDLSRIPEPYQKWISHLPLCAYQQQQTWGQWRERLGDEGAWRLFEETKGFVEEVLVWR